MHLRGVGPTTVVAMIGSGHEFRCGLKLTKKRAPSTMSATA